MCCRLLTSLLQAVKRNADALLAEEAPGAAVPDGASAGSASSTGAAPSPDKGWSWFDGGADEEEGEAQAVSQQADQCRAEELLGAWLADFCAARLAHSPTSAMRLVQARR